MQRYVQWFALNSQYRFVKVSQKNAESRSGAQASARVKALESSSECSLEDHRVISSASACMHVYEQGLGLELASGTLHVDCTVYAVKISGHHHNWNGPLHHTRRCVW